MVPPPCKNRDRLRIEPVPVFPFAFQQRQSPLFSGPLS